MAILDDFAVDYITKRIRHTSGTTVYSVNALYSALQDLFDEPGQMDDPTPMSAQTPTEYTMTNAWFIDDTSTQFLNGGALKSSAWTRVTGTTTGLVRVTYTGTDPITSDLGGAITHTNADAGVILDFDSTNKYIWIRPNSNAAANDFNDTSGTLTIPSGSVTQTVAAATGESIWTNVFTLGTLEDNTDIYIVQNGTKLSAWWTTGQIDVLVRTGVLSSSLTTASTLIDFGEVTIFARQYNKLYDHFLIDLSAGGRNAVPVSTGTDLNNTSGWRAFTGSSGTGTMTDAEVIQNLDTATKGIITSVGGSAASPELEYYIISNITGRFFVGEGYSGTTSAATGIAGTPTNTGAAVAPDNTITVTFGATTLDIANGAGSRPYDCVVDVQGLRLSVLYERMKYITRRGETSDIDNGSQSVIGEQYVGVGDFQIDYTGEVGTFTEGITVTGTASKTAIITSLVDRGTDGTMVWRNTRGPDWAAGDIFSGGGAVSGRVSGAPEAIVPVKAAPFGTFAGGSFFGARGVAITNLHASDAKLYQIIDSIGTVQVPPNVVSVTVAGLVAGDRATVFRLDAAFGAGGAIIKDRYPAVAAQQSGLFTVDMGSALSGDDPTKGTIRFVDTAIADSRTSKEQRYRFANGSTASQTVSLITGSTGIADAAGSTTVLIDSAAFFTGVSTQFGASYPNVQIGDVVFDLTSSNSAEVTSIDSATQLTTTAISGPVSTGNWGEGHVYKVNATDRAYTTSDTAYIPLVDEVADATSEANTLTYSADINVVIRVRQGKVILPFETAGTVGSAGLSVTAIRTTDSIAT